MFNLLKADLYRLFRTRYFWVITALAVIALVSVALFMNWLASPEFAQTVNDNIAQKEQAAVSGLEHDGYHENEEIAPINDKAMRALTYEWGNSFFEGGMLGILGSLLAAILILSDFKKGYIKNLPMDKRGRLNYFGEKLVLIALLQAYILAVCALTSFLSFRILSFTYETVDTLGDVALWLLLAWLYATAMAYITACITWLFKSEVVSSIASLVIAGGIFGAISLQIIYSLANAIPLLGQVPQFLLVSARAELGNGAATLLDTSTYGAFLAVPAWCHIVVVCLAYSIVAAAIVFGICRKNDIG